MALRKTDTEPPARLRAASATVRDDEKSAARETSLGADTERAEIRGAVGPADLWDPFANGSESDVWCPLGEDPVTGEPWSWSAFELRPRILLAEDDVEMRKLVEHELERVGYEVVSCQDGIELLDCVSRVGPGDEPMDFDLIISDIRMPGVDGLSLLEGLREWLELRPLQMILMTAFGDAVTEQRARDLGAAALFAKPFDMKELLAKVFEIVPAPLSFAPNAECLPRGRILVADREAERRANLVWALRRQAFEVEVCRNAGELAKRVSDVALFRSLQRFDAIVCSDSLPGGSLQGVLAAIDDLDELPPILVVGPSVVGGRRDEFSAVIALRCPSFHEVVRELCALFD